MSFGISDSADDLEFSLLGVRELIEFLITKHRDRVTQDSLITAVDAQCTDMMASVVQLVSEAKSTVDVVFADINHLRVWQSAYWSLLANENDIAVRILCTEALIDKGLAGKNSPQGPSIAVRVARIPVLQAVIVDGRMALVSADSAVGPAASVIRAAPVVSSMYTLFEGLWSQGIAAEEWIDCVKCRQTETLPLILRCLQAGVTDEVAARQLSISVRTYRRRVAETMAILNAGSRFQAGMRAAELGLLRPFELERRVPPGSRNERNGES